MSTQPKPYFSFEDYLAAERECVDEKHEYLDGQVFAMTGASFNHNLINVNVASELRQQLKSRPCTVLVNDMRLRIDAADACTYPDVLVLCGEPSFHDHRKDVLTKASLLIEVLSPSTEGYDRGGKFAVYRGLPEFAQYVLIAQDCFSVDVFTRQSDGRWLLEAHTDPNASIRLDAIDCNLRLNDIYDKVRFDLVEAEPDR
ncbi:Uma2 family endonuclease [Thiorhodococcus mannitoliphagus]|uniref:Uma2 family endonuclease n=1 Tax=Thiorhodococcus mannitoliphagus TaxID=329406 RepID=A0A6P1DUE2_9GAMM|nr:Uma2 family endonuclease [Thiorhodococcus mannitoliphagus]NEX21947.1 Uma2 family endonuclease [Thiorhodococcus mannitoliphagus]